MNIIKKTLITIGSNWQLPIAYCQLNVE